MWIRFFFGFSRTEANGFLVLSLLMLLFLFLPLATKHLFAPLGSKVKDQESHVLDSLLFQLNHAIDKTEVHAENIKPFELNTVGAEELISYGMPSFLAQRVINYRTKIKPFSQKSDLLKIYGLDSMLYNKLSPFIYVVIPKEQVRIESESKSLADKTSQNKVNHNFNIYEKERFDLLPFDINRADTTQLKQVYGIGSAYAKRIVAFRDALGGFYRPQQLAEVYGLKPPALDSLLLYAKIKDMHALRRLAINKMEASDLSMHPYISKKQAMLIIAFRKQHGNYLKASDLLQISVFDSSFVEKISPYIQFEE